MFMLFDITFYAYLLPFSSANSFSQSLSVTLLMKGFAVVTPKKITANSLRTHRIAYCFELLTIFNFPRVVDCHYLCSGCFYALKREQNVV